MLDRRTVARPKLLMFRTAHNRPLLVVLLLLMQVVLLPAQSGWRCILKSGMGSCCAAPAAAVIAAEPPSCCHWAPADPLPAEPHHAPHCCCGDGLDATQPTAEPAPPDAGRTGSIQSSQPRDDRLPGGAGDGGDQHGATGDLAAPWGEPGGLPSSGGAAPPPDEPPPTGARGPSLQVLFQVFLL